MLNQPPPDAIARRLEALGVRPDQRLLCTDTDIDRLGKYQPQWLIATSDRLLVLSNGQAGVEPSVIHDLRFAEVSEFRCEGVVGSGLLQARVESVYIDLLRYSNRLGDRFHKVARKLDRALHGEPITIVPEEETDQRRCPTCGLMLEFVGESCPRCVNKGAVFARMLSLMKPYRWAAVGMMLLLLMGIALDLVTPQLTRHLIDNVLPGGPERARELQNSPSLTEHHVFLLLQVVFVLAGVQIVRMVVNIFNGRLGTRIGSAITADMRRRLVAHLEQLGVAYYDRQQVGSLVARVSYDTEAIHGFVNQLTGGFLFQIIMIVGVGIMMFSINPKLAILTLIPAPLVVAGSLIFWRYVYPRYYRYWDASSKQAGMLAGMLSGIRVVKAFSQEAREMERFTDASDRLRESRVNVDTSVATFNPIMGLVFQFGGWIVWYVGGRDVINQHLTGMTLGDLMAFFGYQAMFYGPLSSLTQLTNWLTQFATQSHRIFEVLDTPIQITDARNATPLPEVRGDITFENVTFGYNRHQPVLRDLALKIHAGEMIGVVGRSGSGKTTVVNLICRFYDPDSGRVLIDAQDVRLVRREDLLSRVGVVLQEPFLFRGSIWDNIAYGRVTAGPEEVIASSKAGNCHDFIMNRAHGYDTWVGERGAGLSGGERQRVSIARVLLTDPRILILDEATSSVDAESEAAIQAALHELVKGRTTIAIAHRLSTLRHADRILVVDNGRIAESGAHEELVEKNGLYAHLVNLQGQIARPSVEDLVETEDAKTKLEQAATADHHIRWLTPEKARVHVGNHDALHVTVRDDRIYGGVFAVRCLPVKYPSEYISLRYLDSGKREREVGLIRRITDWPLESQRLIRESLLKRYFIHTISAIHEIRIVHGFLAFDVDTDLGPVQFLMRWQTERAQDYGKTGKILLDTDENRYLIPDVGALPSGQRTLFQRYIYW